MSEAIWSHRPLPYIVRVRVTLTDDSVPTVCEERVVAYSIMEAIVQAVARTGWMGVDDTRYRVEDIAPDLVAYTAILIAERLAQKEIAAHAG